MAGRTTDGVSGRQVEDLINAIEDLGEAWAGAQKVEVAIPAIEVPPANVTVQAPPPPPPAEIHVPKPDPPAPRPRIVGARVSSRDRWGNIAQVDFIYGD